MKTSKKMFYLMCCILMIIPFTSAYSFFSYNSGYKITHFQEERIFSDHFSYNNLTTSEVVINFVVEKTEDIPPSYEYLFIPLSSDTSYYSSNKDITTETIYDEITNKRFRLLKLKLPPLDVGDKYVAEVRLSDDSSGWEYDEEDKLITIKPSAIPDYVIETLNNKGLYFSLIENTEIHIYFPKETFEISSLKNSRGIIKQNENEKFTIFFWRYGLTNISSDELNFTIGLTKKIPFYGRTTQNDEEKPFKEKYMMAIISILGIFVVFSAGTVNFMKKHLTKTQMLQAYINITLLILLTPIYLFSNVHLLLITVIFVLLSVFLWTWLLPNILELVIEREVHIDKLNQKVIETEFLIDLFETEKRKLRRGLEENRISDKTYNSTVSVTTSDINEYKENLEKLRKRINKIR